MIINEKKLSFYSTIFTILVHLILVSFFFINLNNFKNKKPVIQATIIQAAPKKIEQKKIEQKKIEKKQNKPAEKKSTKFPEPKVNSNKDFDIAQRKLKKKREEEAKRKLLEEKKRKDEEKRKLLKEKKREEEAKRKLLEEKKREEEAKRKLLEEKKRKDEKKRKLLEEKKRKKEEKRKEQEKNRREQEKKLKETLERQKNEMLESQKKLDNQLNEIENIEYSDKELLSIIDELKLKISAKIKSNVIYPPNIDNNISAIFEVKVSILGDVLEVVLKEPSGNVYFDNAIESAIYVSSPLPITDNYEMYKRYFQKFDLYFSPEE